MIFDFYTSEQIFTKRLVCKQCGGIEWIETRYFNLSANPDQIIPVHEYKCVKCGNFTQVKNDPFQAPTSGQVILGNGDEEI